MLNQRQQQIIALLTEAGSLRVQALSDQLKVTGATIRNDLRFLEKQGIVERVHGGVNIRADYLSQKKYFIYGEATQPIHQLMAEFVLTQIHDEDAIFLDDCGTTSYLVPLLEQRRHLKVFTNGIHIASALAHNENHEVYLLGGRIAPNGRRVIGGMNCDMLNSMHIHTALISPDGFSLQEGITQNNVELAHAKTGYIAHSTNIIAVVESHRFGKDAAVKIAGLEKINTIVTDAQPNEMDISALTQKGISLVLCSDKEYRLFAGDTRQTTWRIGFANLDDQLPFCRQVRRSLEESARQNQIELIIRDNHLDISSALKSADEFVEADVDLVIEYQIFESLGGVLINKFRSAGIPVIAVDIPIVGATYFGGENFTAGFLAGEALGNWINANWQGQVDAVLMLEDKRSGEMVASRLYGQLDGMQKRIDLDTGKVTHIDCANQADISQTNVAQWLAAHPGFHKIAMICHNDDASFGAIQAVRYMNRESDVAIVGQGCDSNIREEIRRIDSRIIGSTAWFPEQYGPEIITLAMKILKGEQIPPAIHLSHIFIDRDNIDQYYPVGLNNI